MSYWYEKGFREITCQQVSPEHCDPALNLSVNSGAMSGLREAQGTDRGRSNCHVSWGLLPTLGDFKHLGCLLGKK